MKITNKQYALSLYAAVQGKEADELETELKNFVKILATHGVIGKAEVILEEFEKIWQKEKGVVVANVVSADRLEAETLEQLKEYVMNETKTTEVDLKHLVDKKLLAGFILRYNDQIVDGSAKNMIRNLKKELIK